MVISGSPRLKSNTSLVATYVYNLLQEKGVSVNLFDVSQDLLPLYNGDETQRQHPVVAKLFSYAEEADGFFILTPEYHSAMSGALKNALDFLSRNQFQYKPVAITAIAGGGKGGINALNNLRLTIRGVSGLVLTEQCVVDPSDILDSGQLSEAIHLRLETMTDQLIDLTKRLKKE